MKPFLSELAKTIHELFQKLESATIVFPNRRAILYFRKYLGEQLNKPAFSPRLITIEEFISQFTPLKVPDKLELIYRLHGSYYQIMKNQHPDQESNTPEPFDQFYFWGDMLLNDFDEADKYMVHADHLFKDLSHQKELDSSFDFLTEEQQQFLKNFWDNFDENQSLNKRRFLNVWKKLPTVYGHFKTSLRNAGLAYEGMLHRDVAENVNQLNTGMLTPNLIFAGFNALTKAEEKIISYFVSEKNASMFWDMDEYYVNDRKQEAGKFFREYQEHKILKGTFPSNLPANLIGKRKPDGEPRVKIFGAAQPIGQVKLMSQVLETHLKNAKPEETLVVLPDEKMLIPVLHGVSGMVDKLNVTMGFPLASTPLFNLVEILVDLQLTCKQGFFNHRQVLAVLGHPYVVAANATSSNAKRKEILKHNWVHIPMGFLASDEDLHRAIFLELPKNQATSATKNLIAYLKSITEEIGKLAGLSNFDKEYAFHFVKFFNRLNEILVNSTVDENSTSQNIHNDREAAKIFQRSLKSFLRLIRQLVAAFKIPFTGEPLAGLQVMGVLETRNLDFKNVFILSLNEGSFPAISSKGSYIPFNIRKAYSLPTVEHQDAIYSYLFYRVIRRAENVFLFYNSETDVLGQGEMSRYLQQLLYESGIPYEKKVLHNPIQPLDISPIAVKKNEAVLAEMMKLNEGNAYFKGISPSALNTYIECRLKFYLRHVAKIKEANEVEEELDARVLGNFLHDVMEKFYRKIIDSKQNNEIEKDDFINYEPKIDKLIDDVFIKTYRLEPDKAVVYEGQRLVVKEVVKRFVDRIIDLDRKYAPFTIEALEYGGMLYEVPISHAPHKAVLSGKIDRVDKKENLLRIIDYKTGKDKLDFETISSLFTRDTKRNKAAFQTFLYALLYRKSAGSSKSADLKLVPGLLNRMNLFDDEFSFGLKMGKEQINDAEPFLQEFESHVQEVFNDLFNPEQPFDQTNELENCKLCPYSQLCYR
jgi:hypothetical protein